MATKASPIVVVSLLASSGAVSVDSLHTTRRSLYIHSETMLSGIDVYKDKSERAVEKLGPPSHVTVVASTSVSPGWRVFEWEFRTCSVRLVAEDGGPRNSAIESIDVLGFCPNPSVGMTGRGLKLGATISDARRVYSPFGATLSENDTRAMPFLYDFAPLLQIDFDKAGKVHHMKLTNQCVPNCF